MLNTTANYYRNVFLFVMISLFFTGMVVPAGQAEGEDAENPVQINDVEALNDGGSVLELTFSQKVEPIDRFNVRITHEASRERKGVREIEMRDNGTKAVLRMYRTAELERLQDYEIKVQAGGQTLAYHTHRTRFMEDAEITNLEADDVEERRMTLAAGDNIKTVTVPDELKIDLVNVFNKDMNVEINGEDELVSYDVLSEEDTDRDDSYIGQFDMPYYFLIEEKQDHTVSGMNQSVDLERYVLVKNQKIIAPEDVKEGDMLLYNDEERTAEVYNNTISGPLDRVFQESFDIDGENYDYAGSFIDADGDLEAFDADIAEERNGNVTIYLDPDDAVMLVSDK